MAVAENSLGLLQPGRSQAENVMEALGLLQMQHQGSWLTLRPHLQSQPEKARSLAPLSARGDTAQAALPSPQPHSPAAGRGQLEQQPGCSLPPWGGHPGRGKEPGPSLSSKCSSGVGSPVSPAHCANERLQVRKAPSTCPGSC